MTRSTLSLPDGLSRALAALGAVVALAGVAPAAPITDLTASSPAAGNAEHPDFAAACGTANPYLIAVCYPALLTGSPDDDWIALTVFRDTPNNRPHIDIAHGTQIGAVYGLAYSAVEDAVYVGAFHKRALRFGPGGPGAIYRVGLEDGRITVFATVPNAGEDLHGVLPGPDFAARDLAGKASLGDIDLSPDSSELYAVNLFDRRVYRYEAATGKLLGSFPHGAADEPWAPDARPFGLKALDGHVYHGVVNAAQSSQETGELAGYVYESLPDGSGMRLATQIPLDYARGVARIPGLAGSPEIQELPLEWLPWKDGFNTVAPARQLLYPQPQLADIEFDHHGDMVLGFRDRISEMTLSHEITEPEQPGLGLGDILIATKSGDEWTARYDPEPYYDRTSYADESVIGSLAHLPFDDVTVATSLVLVGVPFSYLAPDYGTDWFRYDRAVGVGNRVGHEAVCNVPREYSALTAPLWTTSLGRGLEDLTSYRTRARWARDRPGQKLTSEAAEMVLALPRAVEAEAGSPMEAIGDPVDKLGPWDATCMPVATRYA